MAKTTLTKDELHQLAGAGVAAKIADMERQLAVYHAGWPELFLSPTAPQLLKAPPKASSNGHWPGVAFTPPPPSKLQASWTPARRKRQAAVMRARIAEGKMLRPGRSTKHRSERLDSVHAYLKQHGDSALKDIMKATGYRKSAGLISAMSIGLKSGRFQRTGKGRYALGPKA